MGFLANSLNVNGVFIGTEMFFLIYQSLTMETFL
jgi:hypothetical protein